MDLLILFTFHPLGCGAREPNQCGTRSTTPDFIRIIICATSEEKAETSCYLEHGALAALTGLCYDPQVPGPLHVRLDLLGGAARGVGQRFHQHTVTNTQLHPFPGRSQPECWFFIQSNHHNFLFQIEKDA